MKNIGFLFGNERIFSQDVIDKINISKLESKRNKVLAEPIIIGIVGIYSKSPSYKKYELIFDRFSNAVPFYHSVLKFLSDSGIKVITSSHSHQIEEELLTLQMLKANNINVPKIAIIPSKNLPPGVQGDYMQNLQYPLEWDEMFNNVGFPADIKSNNSNDLFDTYRVYNKQEFFHIYDMSDTKTLLYQECFETGQNIRMFVVGNKTHYLIYEAHKSLKDRYSIYEEYIDDKTEKNIKHIIGTIKSLFDLDMFIMDIVIKEKDKVYLLNISLFTMNIDAAQFLPETYNWLVDSTAEMLLDLAK